MTPHVFAALDTICYGQCRVQDFRREPSGGFDVNGLGPGVEARPTIVIYTVSFEGLFPSAGRKEAGGT